MGIFSMKSVLYSPFFIVGIFVRFILIICFLPFAVTEWLQPFLATTISPITFDPWSTWISSGGSPVAFPYGYVMWLIFIPGTLISKLFNFSIHYSYSFTLLVSDVLLLLTLHRFVPAKSRLLLLTYWLSPICLISTYILGYNDVVPVLFLFLSILFIYRVQLKFSALFLACAISAKLSMLIALPFYVIYFINNKSLRQKSLPFLITFLVSVSVLYLPIIESPQWLLMIFSNPKVSDVYELSFDLGSSHTILIAPLLYSIVLYFCWRVRRLNFLLFQSAIGISFFTIALIIPSSPGWLFWVLPFLVLYQIHSGRIAIFLVASFSLLFTLNSLSTIPIVFSYLFDFDGSYPVLLQQYLPGKFLSLLYTASLSIGTILILRMWRESITRNDFFRFSRKPFVLGVAGDINSGKNTYTKAITSLFGLHSVVSVNSDDYYLWDKHKPIWQVMTRLNPISNQLAAYCNDLISLIDGKSVPSRVNLSPHTKKPPVLKTNDFIIASGLHAFYLPIARDCCDLKVFLDTHASLKDYFSSSKTSKDQSSKRNRDYFDLQNIDSTDFAKFIQPQSCHADLVLSLVPIHPRFSEDVSSSGFTRLKLSISSRNGLNELLLQRILIGVCGLHVDVVVGDNASDIHLSVEGDVSAEDIAAASSILCPSITEFLDISPKWEGGMLGLMQLVTLSHINNTLTRRIIT